MNKKWIVIKMNFMQYDIGDDFDEKSHELS